jgi:YbbR domain-containing protein
MTSRTFKRVVLLCLVFGLTGILFPADARESESQIKVPVIIQNLPPETMVTGPSFQGIELHVRGPAERLAALRDLKLQYVLNLSAMKTGNHTVPVRIEQLNLPQGLTVVSIQPQTIQVHLEKAFRKKVAVTVFFKGTPASGYFVAHTSAVPGEVLLRGPQRVLHEVKNVSTHPVDVSGVSESFKKEITLDLSQGLDVVTPKTPILAEITISEEILTTRFTGIAVQGNDSPHAYEITPAAISIVVKGPATLLESLSSSPDFSVYVDIKGLEPGVYVRRASLVLPVGTTLVSAEPEIFTIRIGK